MPVRVYDIAKKLGIESKEVIAKAKALGITAAKVPSSSLDKITTEYLEQQLGGVPVVKAEPVAAALASEPIIIVASPPPPPLPPPPKEGSWQSVFEKAFSSTVGPPKGGPASVPLPPKPPLSSPAEGKTGFVKLPQKPPPNPPDKCSSLKQEASGSNKSLQYKGQIAPSSGNEKENTIKRGEIPSNFPEEPKKRIVVVDGSNVLLSYDRSEPRFGLAILLTVLIELTKRGFTFVCVFDGSIETVFEGDTDGRRIFCGLVHHYKRGFGITTGRTEADIFILQKANEKRCVILSNDKYREYERTYPWLRRSRQRFERYEYNPNEARVIPGNLIGGCVQVPELNIHTELVLDVGKLTMELIGFLEKDRASYRL